MKALLLLLAGFASFALWGETVTPIVPNGDFENWNINSYTFPESYLFNSNAFKAMTGMPYNVNQTSDCYHGKSAVKLVTDASTNNVNFGFIIGSNGENSDPTTWKGGIPVTQPVTGIRGYYKYDFQQPDSALIIVVFKYRGTFLGEYDFFLKEKQSTYTLFDFNITPMWNPPVSPDTVIVGFASSGNVEKGFGQPGSTLFLDSISLKGLSMQPAALNGDFERWTQHITAYPQDWNLSGTETEDAWRSNDKYEGNWSVKLSTYRSSGENGQSKEQSRSLYLGNYDKNTNQWQGGLPLENVSDTLSLWYKYQPAQPEDKGVLMLTYLLDNNPIWGNQVLLGPTANWKERKVSLQIPYNLKGLGCSLILMFQSSLKTDSTLSHIGSSLYLDHLSILPYLGSTDTVQTGPNPVLDNEGFETWESHPYDIPKGYPFTSNQLRLDGKFPFNVTKTSLAQHGSYALRLETDNMTDNANFGFIVNQSPTAESPFKWTGGIPYAERPTGLQGYYMLHTVGVDSAMIMAHFLKNGNLLGLYFLYLQPAPGDWTYFNKPLNPPLAETPDSMILTIASGSNLGGMCPPGCVLMLDNLSWTGVASQPAGMNGDFEEWITERMESAPGWFLSDQERPGSHQTTNAAVGNYALEIRTTTHTNEAGQRSVDVNWVSNGNWDRNIQNWVGGSPLRTMDDTLAFYYQYLPSVPDDTAQLSMMFKSQGQFIASNSAFLLPNTSWQRQEVALHGYGPMGMVFPVDSILLIFQTSLWNHQDPRFIGSTLQLDDVHFLSSRKTIGRTETALPESPSLYPNPCQGRAWIHTGQTQSSRIDVFNLTGQSVRHLDATSADIPLDLTNLPPGLYLVRLNNTQQNRTFKLLLK
jgi:hypothetical protein